MDRKRLVSHRGGHAVPSEVIGRQLYLSRTFDPHLLTILERLARGSRVIVDVGANVGFFSLSMAAAERNAVVYCVEPQPRLASLLARSARESGLDNVHVHEFALSDASGEASFVLNPKNLGNSRIDDAPSEGEVIRVKLVLGSKFLADLGVRAIDLMKVDVEGHEAQVMRGIEPWLAGCRIRNLLFEPRGHGDDRTALDIVLRHGYQILGVDKGLTRPKVCRCNAQHSVQHEDLIAVRGNELQRTLSALDEWVGGRAARSSRDSGAVCQDIPQFRVRKCDISAIMVDSVVVPARSPTFGLAG